MFDSVFQSFEKLISEFSWRRLVFLLSLLLLAGTCVWLWENNTGQMRLTRIERTIAILSSIKDLQEHQVIKADPSLQSTLAALKEDLKEFTERKSETPILGTAWRKALAGAAPWLLFTLLFLPALKTGKVDDLNGLLGCVILAVALGAIGAWLPDFPYAWMNYIGYPAVNFVIIMAIALWWQKRQRARITSRSTGPRA